MADADEEDPHAAAQHHVSEVDLSDEAQDFRFLSLVSQTDRPTAIPRRGEKDFEPHGTSHQASLLAASRDAMHAALSTTRIHVPKAHVLGYWHWSAAAGQGQGQGQCAVPRPRGPHFKTMGRADARGIVWLLPEEMLYLLERGGLDVRWGGVPSLSSEGGGGCGDGHGEEAALNGGEEGLIPMSLQGAYAVAIGDEREGKIGLERWVVYSGLKRTGYTVMRAPSWVDEPERRGDEVGTGQDARMQAGRVGVATRYWLGKGVFGLFRMLFKTLFGARPVDHLPFGPLVKPGLYRTYTDIYRLLSLIPFHDASTPSPSPDKAPSKTTPPFRIALHVWKPRPTFRKSSPDPPDFRIAVINARETPLPTLAELSALLETVPYDPPPERLTKGQSYQRLRHGYRNVVLAVVDQGVTSYLRVSDAVFGAEKVYERYAGGGARGKGGGGKWRGGGRGRGRGRGR